MVLASLPIAEDKPPKTAGVRERPDYEVPL